MVCFGSTIRQTARPRQSIISLNFHFQRMTGLICHLDENQRGSGVLTQNTRTNPSSDPDAYALP